MTIRPNDDRGSDDGPRRAESSMPCWPRNRPCFRFVLASMPGSRVGAGDPGHDGRGDGVEGVTNLAAPWRMASRGMPKTMQVASFCAMVDRAASRIPSRPPAPSSPMPVMITPAAIRAGRLGGRAKQDLDAGTVAANRRALDQLDTIARARPANEAVHVARDRRAPGRAGSARAAAPRRPRSGFSGRCSTAGRTPW